MNTVFPSISSTTLAAASPGSIVRFFRSDESIFALVTNQKATKTPALVLLNAKVGDKPPVLFADSWRDEKCLTYNDEIQFEVGTSDDLVDPRGNEWWETAGTIVVVDSQLLIRAVEFQSYGFPRFILVNIQTGELFTDPVPNGSWTFGKWSLVAQREKSNQKIELCKFQAARTSQR